MSRLTRPTGRLWSFFWTFRISCGKWVEQVRSLRNGIGAIWKFDKSCTGSPNNMHHDVCKKGGHKVRDNIWRKIRGGLDIRNANNGELTPREKSRGTWRPQTICMTCAKGGGDKTSATVLPRLLALPTFVVNNYYTLNNSSSQNEKNALYVKVKMSWVWKSTNSQAE